MKRPPNDIGNVLRRSVESKTESGLVGYWPGAVISYRERASEKQTYG